MTTYRCDAPACSRPAHFRSSKLWDGYVLYYNTCDYHQPKAHIPVKAHLGYKCHVETCENMATHRQWGIVDGCRRRIAVCSGHFNPYRKGLKAPTPTRDASHVAADSEAYEGRLFGVRWTKTSLEEALEDPPKQPRPPIDFDMPMVEGPPPYYFLTKCRCITCMVTYRHWSTQLSPLEALSQAGFKWALHGYECPRCVKERRLTLEARLRNKRDRIEAIAHRC